MARLRMGTCSWKYDSWEGLVYSKKKPLNYLEEYSKIYNTVEIDQWFWSLFGPDKIVLPSPFTAQEYAESVPENFKFSVKAPNSVTLTHFYRRDKSAPLEKNPNFLSIELFGRFLEALGPLYDKMGPVMFQFEYLNKQKMSSQGEFQEKIAAFIEKLSPGYTYMIEIRNSNYLNRNYFRFLNSINVGHVFLEGYYMPPVSEIYRKFSEHIQKISVLRLHGPDRSDIETKSKGIWNRILEPRSDEMKKIAEVVNNLLDKKVDVYVNMNNHYEGSAPLSIQRLEKLIEGGQI